MSKGIAIISCCLMVFFHICNISKEISVKDVYV